MNELKLLSDSSSQEGPGVPEQVLRGVIVLGVVVAAHAIAYFLW